MHETIKIEPRIHSSHLVRESNHMKFLSSIVLIYIGFVIFVNANTIKEDQHLLRKIITEAEPAFPSEIAELVVSYIPTKIVLFNTVKFSENGGLCNLKAEAWMAELNEVLEASTFDVIILLRNSRHDHIFPNQTRKHEIRMEHKMSDSTCELWYWITVECPEGFVDPEIQDFVHSRISILYLGIAVDYYQSQCDQTEIDLKSILVNQFLRPTNLSIQVGLDIITDLYGEVNNYILVNKAK
eukprot:738862_1